MTIINQDDEKVLLSLKHYHDLLDELKINKDLVDKFKEGHLVHIIKGSKD